MPVERTEFKGSPVLVLKRSIDDKYPFSFGLSKARLIVANIDEISKFIAEMGSHEAKEQTLPPPPEDSDQMCKFCGKPIAKKRLEALPGITVCVSCAQGLQDEAELQRKKQEALKAQIQAGVICPMCKGKLVVKFGKNGQFKGCINYPKCEYTQAVFWGK